MSVAVDLINKRLRKMGLNPYGQPLFRVVWSNYQTEKRRGVFNEFYGDLFVRTTFGVHERLKYPWIKDKWVLERWYPPEIVHHEDLPESNRGSYEPIYVFQDANGNALPPVWRAVQLIIYAIMNPVSPALRKSQLELEAEKMKNEEYMRDLEAIGGEVSPVEERFARGEAVFINSR
jgi:hypothetical protein